MIKIHSIKGKRNYDNPDTTPDLHWVELVFENEFGTHTLELNGERPLPDDPALRSDLEWLLWDYGLLEQQDSRTAKQRVRIVQNKFDDGDINHPLARAYMETLGTPAGR